MTCPICHAPLKPWDTGHVKSCTALQLALLVREVDDIVPVVDEKPKGWGWVRPQVPGEPG